MLSIHIVNTAVEFVDMESPVTSECNVSYFSSQATLHKVY